MMATKIFEVRVHRKDSENSVAEVTNVEVAAGSQKLVKLPLLPKTSGRHWIRVWIEGDGFEGDNRIFVPYICEQKGDIYFVGDRAAGTFGLLPLALSPSGDGRFTSLVPSFLPLDTIKSRLQQKMPMLVVLTWADASSLDEGTSALLDQYTQRGGNILGLTRRRCQRINRPSARMAWGETRALEIGAGQRAVAGCQRVIAVLV